MGGGEELRGDGVVAPAREAASVLLLRGGAGALHVALVKRNPGARFMPSVWVFPGGAVDPGEDLRGTALRELAEEAGIALAGPDALVPFSQWITPEAVTIRFDTHFFLAAEPPGQELRADGAECVDQGWFAPAEALRAHERGAMDLVFPTIKHLEQLAAFPSADAVLAHARAHRVQPVLPKVVPFGETARVLLPDDPGYAEAG